MALTKTVAVTRPAISALDAKWPQQGEWTREDWLRLPNDGFRYEVLNGELYMTPPPAIQHQFASANLFSALRDFVQRHSLGYVLYAPCGVYLPTHPVPVQPDILFIHAERRGIIGAEYIEGAPDLVVEVLSPSNWLYDRREKFQAYQKAGVPEYWIVDYRARTIDVFFLEKGTYTLLDQYGAGEIARSRILEGFEVAVSEVFTIQAIEEASSDGPITLLKDAGLA
jgi:Uma2 family endonuclease